MPDQSMENSNIGVPQGHRARSIQMGIADSEAVSNDREGQPNWLASDADPHALHAAHINPRFATVLRLIGFDRTWVSAEGSMLIDDRGERFLDLLAGYGMFNMGRNHPRVREALMAYLQSNDASLVQLGTSRLTGLLAKRLKALVDNRLERVHFTSSGHEGIETAIKFSRAATGKPAILYAACAFHGLSTGALALNGTTLFRRGFEPFLPDCRQVPFDDLEALEAALARGDVAAFVVEPIQGKRVAIARPGYLREAARLCHRHGALLVADEVQTGLGRTGRMFAFEHDRDVEPDIIVIAKALSGGYVPVGAVLYPKWVYNKVFSSLDRAVVHSSTFGQGGLAMAAGLAALDVIEEEDLCGRAARLGNRLGYGLQALQNKYEFLADVRWRGLMLGLEFGPPRSLALKAGWSLAHGLDQNLFCQALIIPLFARHHMLTQVSGPAVDIIKLIPPLVITEAEIDSVVDAFDDVLREIHRFPGPAWTTIAAIGRNAARQTFEP
jgi:ornithine--oxo-acid transaminase